LRSLLCRLLKRGLTALDTYDHPVDYRYADRNGGCGWGRDTKSGLDVSEQSLRLVDGRLLSLRTRRDSLREAEDHLLTLRQRGASQVLLLDVEDETLEHISDWYGERLHLLSQLCDAKLALRPGTGDVLVRRSETVDDSYLIGNARSELRVGLCGGGECGLIPRRSRIYSRIL
jgi:hypothetical protein